MKGEKMFDKNESTNNDKTKLCPKCSGTMKKKEKKEYGMDIYECVNCSYKAGTLGII